MFKARIKGAKDKKPRKSKGQRIQDLKDWADSEPKHRVKPGRNPHDIPEPKTKTQEFVGETNKALYVILTDGFEKAEVKGYTRTRKGKLERVSPYAKQFALKEKRVNRAIERMGKKKEEHGTWSGSDKDERKQRLREAGVTVWQGLVDKEFDKLPEDVQDRLWGQRRKLTTGKDWGSLPKAKGMTSQEKKFWDRYHKGFAPPVAPGLHYQYPSRESFGLDKAKKKNLSPEDRLKMAEVNPSGNEN